MRPFIGITCSTDDAGRPSVKPSYVRAVHAAGGLPVPLPMVSTEEEARELLSSVDGMVFSGSDDLDPALWGEARHRELVLMHPARAATEWLLARQVLARRMPALGICGGMQTLNVAAGGSLHQHIPDLARGLEHQRPDLAAHAVEVERGSRLGALLGARITVNSRHHQAVNRLGGGLRPVASAPDGLVEAMEDPGSPFLVGVQWHPEDLVEDPAQLRLFTALSEAAAHARGP